MRTPSFLIFAFFVVVTAALPAAAQTCTADDPETCDADGNVSFCNADLQLEAISCESAFGIPGATCAPLDCGPDCPGTVGCENVRGAACSGIGTLFDADDANNGATLMTVGCAGTDVCVAGATGETCVARPAGVATCTAAGEGHCVGDLLTACIGFADSDAFLAAPGVLDCSVFGAGFTCDDSGPNPTCVNPACGAELAGRCDGSTAIHCTDGVEDSRENCATFGDTCVQDAADQDPQCVTADPQCGSGGGGVCDGQVATICAGGQFQTTTDCAVAGLVCGVVAGTTRVGCIEPGSSSEGEGEPGDPECEEDSDCDDDEECDDGECVDEGGGGGRRGGGGGTPVEPPGLFSCNDAGAFPVAAVFAGVAVIAVGRRRRRFEHGQRNIGVGSAGREELALRRGGGHPAAHHLGAHEDHQSGVLFAVG
jgi:hypothetical protein